MTTISENYEESYFEKRLAKLGITSADNQVKLWRFNADTGNNELQPVPVFRESDKGIDILVYTITRQMIQFKPEGNRWSQPYYLTRFKDPIVDKNGGIRKYNIPKGQGTYPFFHPTLIDAFEKQTPIPTLYLTEGFFKAWKGCMHGIPVIGLSSITHMKDLKTGGIHEDIEKLMHYCSVKKVVWLTDGDCLDITSKELEDGMDLYKRPLGFYQSAQTFRTLLDKSEAEKWFMHIDIDTILQNNLSPIEGGGLGCLTRDQVKGLDDLLCTFPDRIPAIGEDIKTFNKNQDYFVKFNISTGTSKLYKHFHLYDINEFYAYHSDRRHELKKVEFKFNGTTYRFDEEQQQCVIVMPAKAKDYCRVGDNYYEFVWVPNKYGQLEKRLDPRARTTIVEDHGKDFCKHIAKYKTFCNVPSHINFQQVISNCFNMYSQFEWEADETVCSEADCPIIMSFLKHVFGENEVTFTHPEDKKKRKYINYDLGLDYIQLLLQSPEKKLPILCLVSKANNTGKSTFGKFLKLLFTGNVAIVGNHDISNDFNGHWASKLVVVCDEAKIDKQVVVEKVKSLSTSDKIFMNKKGKDQTELECFIKFIFITNNEDNFISVTDEDIRFWVLKVPTLVQEVTKITESMKEEIPAFLSFLSRRKLATENLNRMWFHPTLLKTDAFKKIVENSQTVIEKELRAYFRDAFRDFGQTVILMTKLAVQEHALRNRFESNYVEKAITELIKAEQYHIFVYNNRHFDTWNLAAQAVRIDLGMNTEDIILLRNIQRKYVTKRHEFPKWELRSGTSGSGSERIPVFVKDNGRPYIFKREMFLSQDEIDSIQVETEMQQFIGAPPAAGSDSPYPIENTDIELPF